MPIIQIEGGLGSQMFGYAAARRLALRTGEQVFIDTRLYRTYPKFRPELQHFAIEAEWLPDDVVDELCGTADELVQVVRPRHLHVDPEVLTVANPHVLMKGNFVSEDYFFDVTRQVRSDFRRVSAVTAHCAAVAEEIGNIRRAGFTPVSVHVRRGDYRKEADVLAVHGLCEADYYQRAMELMRRLVHKPWWVVFSDEPEIAAQVVDERRAFVVPGHQGPPVDDMLLMAECDSHIVANSGYSWWGAWLGETPEQVVVAPRPFFSARTLSGDDMIKRTWLTVGAQPPLAS